jgi:hypothetical protein
MLRLHFFDDCSILMSAEVGLLAPPVGDHIRPLYAKQLEAAS